MILKSVQHCFFGLIKNHAFHDGNKRTALLVGLYHLYKIGRIPKVKQREFETLAVRTAGNRLDQYSDFSRYKGDERVVKFLAQFFRKKTRIVDGRSYLVTYSQLNGILQRFKYCLANPSGNYIDVVREEEEVWGLLRRKRRVVQRRVTQVGFPGWTKEVRKKLWGLSVGKRGLLPKMVWIPKFSSRTQIHSSH